MRKIVHVDADAFFASVELRDDPTLRGKAVAVAYHGPRSVVTTATYEARQYGVRSALPLKTALTRCPHLIVIEPRMDVYREASRIMQGVFHEFTDLVEPLSLDEAYLDVTDPKRGPRSATLIAQEIRRLVRERTGGLTVSAGVSYNKLLAKLGSGMNKPDGLRVILPHEADALLARLPMEAFFGIGPVTAGKLERMGIRIGADLRARPLAELTSAFGAHGAHMYAVARGSDERPVNPADDRKSVGTEDTYDTDLRTFPEVLEKLPDLSERTARRLSRLGLAGRVVTVKVKFANFDLVSRQLRLTAPVQAAEEIGRVARHLLTADLVGGRAVRLLGVSVSGLVDPGGRDVPVPLFRVV